MANLKNRFVDQAIRLIRRHLRFEVCAVDEVQWHREPGDDKFNTVTVVMRDRSQKVAPNKTYYRIQLPCLQSTIGHYLGKNWNPRKGDLVRVWFYAERKGIVLGSTWSWAQYPVCRDTPYDEVEKGGQWIAPYQDGCGDFPKQPYPEAKKPYCFKWFHGPVTGTTGKGRDHLWLFDYCHEGDACPDCHTCKTIDDVCRCLNHGFKFYSEETQSKVSHPLRGEYFAPCGSYWMFESKCCGDCENCTDTTCCSEMFTEGKGFWTIQGATCSDELKGHVRHSPTGTMDIHSMTQAARIAEESTGTRVVVVAPDDDTVDYAVEAKDFVTGAYIRILKSGKIECYSPSEILLKADEKITLQAPLVDEITDLVHNHGDQQIDGHCTHGSCSCGA